MNKRKAAIGYATFWVGRRAVRRQVKRRISGLIGTGERSAVRRRLPIVGAVAAVIAAAALMIGRRSRGAG